jgi:ketosteroid isomerase-like protein
VDNRLPSGAEIFSDLMFHGLAFMPYSGLARWTLPSAVVGLPVAASMKLTEDAVREIEQIHSSWIEFEIAGRSQSLLALCADDIELWPPDAQPLLGRDAVSAQMAHGTTGIRSIEITDRRIQGSCDVACLTASYKTTFSATTDSTPGQAIGSHLWILRKQRGTWVVALVSWSVWAAGL